VALRCLLVDDNGDFLAAAGGLLEQEGISVVGVASTSAEATRRVAELRPELIRVDVNLGEESGFDLARRLAKEGDGVQPAVILISTYARTDLADVIASSPEVGFLSKSDLSGRAIRGLLDGRRGT
jgi:CheY-like chemotaxis protein